MKNMKVDANGTEIRVMDDVVNEDFLNRHCF